MSTIAKDSGGALRTPAPAGSHRACCVGVIDLGTQKFDYNGEVSYPHKVMLQFELSDELMEDGRPYMVSEEFTLSLNEKANLLKFLNSWRGRPFTPDELKGWDLAHVLGAAALINVIHKLSKKGSTFAKIAAASPLPRGMARPEPINPVRHYQVEDGPPPAELPDWIAAKINACEEFKGTLLTDIRATTGPVADDEDIPF
jgi:hypothetical protein